MENSSRHNIAIEMYDRERQRIREAGAYGLRSIGVLNGIPAVQEDSRANDDRPDRLTADGLTCSLAADGSELWRHIGLGSV